MIRPIVLIHSDPLAPGTGMEIAATRNQVARFVCTRLRDDALVIARRVACEAIVLELTGDTDEACALVERLRDAGYGGRVLVLLAEAGAEASARLIQAGAGGVLPSANSPMLVLAGLRELLTQSSAANDLDEGNGLMKERDREVLQLVWDGESNKEIASRLNCSVSLVKASLQRLFAKTGVHTRTQLLRRVMVDRTRQHPPVAAGPPCPR